MSLRPADRARNGAVPPPSRRGFSLVEVAVVLFIVGALAAVTVLPLLLHRNKYAEGAVRVDLRNAAAAEEKVHTGSGAYTSSVGALQAAGFTYSDGRNYAGDVATITATHNSGLSYCLEATAKGGQTFHYASTGGVAKGTC